MKFCICYENIGIFKDLCPNFDCSLLLYFKKYWAAFFSKISQNIYFMISVHKIRQKFKNDYVHFQWMSRYFGIFYSVQSGKF